MVSQPLLWTYGMAYQHSATITCKISGVLARTQGKIKDLDTSPVMLS